MSTYADTESGQKTSPVSVFQFQVYTMPVGEQENWLPKGRVGFTGVSGLGNMTESIEYKEGNDLYGDQVAGRSRPSGDLVLSRGLDVARHLLRWRSAILERTTLPGAASRCTIYIDMYNRQGVPGVGDSPAGAELIQRWRIQDAWPKDYVIDDLDSRGGTDITVQRCTFASRGVPELLYPLPTV